MCSICYDAWFSKKALGITGHVASLSYVHGKMNSRRTSYHKTATRICP